jgi:putative ABC transport system permease protein
MHNWRDEIERRLPGAARRSARLDEVLQELSEHLDERFEELRAGGTDEADARRLVLDELNESSALQREIALMTSARIAPPPIGDERRASFFGDVRQDLRFAARMLRKSPGFTAVAMLTLALGIGANTAIFTVINAVMLRPLPYAEPDRLVRIWESNPPLGWPTFGVSHPNYLDWAAQTRAFDALAAAASAGFTLSDGGNAERVIALASTHTFLPLLGTTPLIGRNFQADEDRPGGNTRVALLTYSYWHRRFGADPNVLGRTLTLNNQPYTVIGVLPEDFAWGAQLGSSSTTGGLELIVPLAPDPARNRADHRLAVIGRLKAGITLDQAQADLAAVAATLQRQYPESNQGWTVRTRSFYEWIVPEETRRSLTIFAVAVLAVLLIACGNVASLMLARASARHKEISVRLALGARRSRVVRQLLVEAVLLSLIAGVAGLVIALGATRVLQGLSPGNLPRLGEVSIDARVIGFGLGISFLTGIVFGLVPAFTGLRVDVSETLKETARGGGSSPARQRFRGALVIGELALSVTLLVGAGMLLRSFWQVQKVDPGFNTDHILTMQLNLPLDRYDTAVKAWSFYERLLRELASVPGISAAALTSGVPMSPGNTSTNVRIPGREVAPGEKEGSADWRIVSPDYFRTMGIALRGREFAAADMSRTAPVTIVSQAFVKRYWPGEDALGKTAVLPSAGDNPATIVGIAGDVRSFGLDAETPPMVYFPTPAVPRWNPMSIVVRTEAEPTAMIASARATLRAIDPAIPFYGVTTVDELLDTTLGSRRFMMFLVTSFATIALVLASVGLFGVMAYLVAQRAREIGIRLALGARPADVFRSVIGRGFALAAIGATLGVAAAIWLTPLMESFLFEVNAVDPVTFIGAPITLVLVALLACYLPARRAMRLDPLVALREE